MVLLAGHRGQARLGRHRRDPGGGALRGALLRLGIQDSGVGLVPKPSSIHLEPSA